MGEDRIAWKANEGIRISRIAKHVKQQNLSPTQRRLRDEMFEQLPLSPSSDRAGGRTQNHCQIGSAYQ
jgi:hypothetical protein